MNRSIRITVSVAGAYAGLLGMAHGYFVLLQGGYGPEEIIFNAIGPPCQPETVYHACFPAMTIVPNLSVAGILAIVTGLAMVIWAVASVQRRRGGLVLMGFALILLLVGSGFIPFFTGVIAGAAATQINGQLSWLQRHISRRSRFRLARLWPWSLVAYFSWLLAQWLLGTLANAFMLDLGGFPLIIELALLLLAVFSAFSADSIQADRA